MSKLIEIDTKDRICYYLDNGINIDDLDFDNILLGISRIMMKPNARHYFFLMKNMKEYFIKLNILSSPKVSFLSSQKAIS